MEDAKNEELMMFESVIASRLIHKGRDNISSYSTMMLDIIVKYSGHEREFLDPLSRCIETILDIDSSLLSMEQVLDYLKELSNYAAMFVFNPLYKNVYDLVVGKINRLRYIYPVNELDWVESAKGY